MRHIVAILFTILFVIACNHDDGKKYLRDVYFDYHTSTIALTDTLPITLMFYPEHTNAGVPNEPIVWQASDTTIVQIEQTGEYTAQIIAIGVGSVTIKASLGGFVTSTIITVDVDNSITDSHFKDLCLACFDKNNDGVLQGTEITNVIGIDATELEGISAPISFAGIEIFKSLRTFKATHLIISELDLSHNTNLTDIDISESEIESIDLSHNLEVRFLDCHACTNLSQITLGSSTVDTPNQMRIINCQRCNLSTLDVSNCSLLEYLDCSKNKLTQLNLSNNTLLKQLSCQDNNIGTITLWSDANIDEFQTLEYDNGVVFVY